MPEQKLISPSAAGFVEARSQAFLRMAAERGQTTFLDEVAISYEAARLDSHAVVVIFWQDARNDIHLHVVKGGDCVARYLRDQCETLDLVSIPCAEAESARALEVAFKRRVAKPALRVVS